MEEININQTPVSQPNISDLPAQNNKNIYKYLFFIAIVILLGVIVGFYFVLNNKIKQLETKQITQITPTTEEISITPTKTEITPMATSTVKPVESTLVEKDIIVKGKVCYPSESVPNGHILAKNVQTNKIESFPFTYESKNQNFSISLQEGSYVFAYEANNDKSKGYYSKCALTTNANDCSTVESHKPIIVNVKNTTIEGVVLCDYYYGKGEEPIF